MNKITPADALDALNNLDDYIRMDGDFVINAQGALKVLFAFIKQHSTESDLKDDVSIQIIKWFDGNVCNQR